MLAQDLTAAIQPRRPVARDTEVEHQTMVSDHRHTNPGAGRRSQQPRPPWPGIASHPPEQPRPIKLRKVVYAFPEGTPLDDYEQLHSDVESLVYTLLAFEEFTTTCESEADLDTLEARFKEKINSFETPSRSAPRNRSGPASWTTSLDGIDRSTRSPLDQKSPGTLPKDPSR
ncbi:hypothetical protein GCM10023237_00400 [Streptomyces coeruleoprunus]|uniref:hypothetical protein n=1 Tax=Streptomyces coeruleoprunus TaxID=285563 RepID=UPI0031EA8AAC